MGHIVEKEWTTEAGLTAAILVIDYSGRKSHRCGYVGVSKEHPLFGIDYNEQCSVITPQDVEELEIGKRGIFTLFTAACDSDDGTRIRRSPDILFDVHGGLTYSGGDGKYPIESKLWWYGFDCHHLGDGEIEPDPDWPFLSEGPARSLSYVVDECESLARQLVKVTGEEHETAKQ